jgi:hypothetical protein
VENAKQKLQQKGLDLIVANDITASDSGFGSDNNRVTIIDREGKIDSLPLLPKREVADKILDRVVGLFPLKGGKVMTRVEITLRTLTQIRHYQRIDIPKDIRHIFPDYGVPFTVETEIPEIIEYKKKGLYKQKNGKDHFHMRKWFKAHPELKEGDKLIIEVIEPMKHYRLKIDS